MRPRCTMVRRQSRVHGGHVEPLLRMEVVRPSPDSSQVVPWPAKVVRLADICCSYLLLPQLYLIILETNRRLTSIVYSSRPFSCRAHLRRSPAGQWLASESVSRKTWAPIGRKSTTRPTVLSLNFGNEPFGNFTLYLYYGNSHYPKIRVLVALDRLSSAALGRPCAIQDEEYALLISCHGK